MEEDSTLLVEPFRLGAMYDDGFRLGTAFSGWDERTVKQVEWTRLVSGPRADPRVRPGIKILSAMLYERRLLPS